MNKLTDSRLIIDIYQLMPILKMKESEIMALNYSSRLTPSFVIDDMNFWTHYDINKFIDKSMPWDKEKISVEKIVNHLQMQSIPISNKEIAFALKADITDVYNLTGTLSKNETIKRIKPYSTGQNFFFI